MPLITATLTNDLGSLQLPTLNVPFTEQTIENATDVETLDGNIYTDFIRQKRRWVLVYGYLKEADYNAIRAFYNQQFIDFKYPLLTTNHWPITDVPVRMYMNDKQVFNNCGDVENVSIILRESRQLS